MPEDVIKQLVGTVKGWDQHHTMDFQFYGCSKYDGNDVEVDFEKGILTVYDKGGDTVLKNWLLKPKLSRYHEN